MRKPLFSLSALTLAICQMTYANATTWQPTQSDFGGVGLMQMPTGRFASDGSFAVAGSINSEYQHYTVSLQVMPWLESTIRYTIIPDLDYSSDPSFSADNSLTDKGIDAKFKLLSESYWLPEVALGFRDIGGTGLFDGEYLAASKRFGPLDFTLGIGWGYIGNGANLGGNKSRVDCGRNTPTSGSGGLVEFNRFFRGCSSIYGGIEYQTPWEPLRLKLEYDGNDYLNEVLSSNGVPVVQDSKFNYGLVYLFDDWGELRASYERGNTWTLGFTLKNNFNTLSQVKLDKPRPVYEPEQDAQNIDWQQVAKELGDNAGYQQAKIYTSDDLITVVGNQTKFRNDEEALSRAATLIANTGTSAKTYQIIEYKSNLPISQTNIDAEKFAKASIQESLDTKLSDSMTRQTPRRKISEQNNADLTKPWSFGLSPSLRQSFGGSEDFYLFNIGIVGNAHYWLTDSFKLNTDVYVNLYDNYDKFLYTTPPDGTDLKRVRTLIRQYISDNAVRVNNLQATYFGKFGDDWYTQVYGGYLESMFAGVGGELLYRPYDSNWAFGLDLNYVVQRDPNSAFGLYTEERQFDSFSNRSFLVQTGTPTGHFSVYYRPQWSYFDNMLVKLSAGQYLTEDIGATLDISKQFKSGVIVGAYAAQTNLSAEEFGEGSFNKGFYISVPLDALTIKSSTNRAVIGWAPLTRDGGQMLRRKYSLYDITSSRDSNSELTH